MDYRKESLRLHGEWKGKIEVKSRVKINSKEDLSLAYTPGVAEACLAIKEDKFLSYTLTRRNNLVAVITDGTAVLGLGDIGPLAGMPVMEGKCVLFKEFADIDAFPLCINSRDVDEIVNTIYLLSGSFGGINLEDFSAPRCYEIERRLKELCDIPVFHDDQHGTAVVCLAAVINALKVVGKDIENIRVVVNGGGSAGVAISKMFLKAGVTQLLIVDKFGVIYDGLEDMNSVHKEIAKITNPKKETGGLTDVIKGADVFIGVSAPDVLTVEMVKTMNRDAIVLAMANPTPEIMPLEAKAGGAKIVGTGRSDFNNQINNVLAFPGIFKGALSVRATDINEEMKLAAAYAIANLINDDELNEDYIIPAPLDKRVVPAVSEAVAKAAVESSVARI